MYTDILHYTLPNFYHQHMIVFDESVAVDRRFTFQLWVPLYFCSWHRGVGLWSNQHYCVFSALLSGSFSSRDCMLALTVERRSRKDFYSLLSCHNHRSVQYLRFKQNDEGGRDLSERVREDCRELLQTEQNRKLQAIQAHGKVLRSIYSRVVARSSDLDSTRSDS